MGVGSRTLISIALCAAAALAVSGCLKKEGGGLLGVGDAGNGEVTQINPTPPPPPAPKIKFSDTDAQGGRMQGDSTTNFGVSKTAAGGNMARTQATSANYTVRGGISAGF